MFDRDPQQCLDELAEDDFPGHRLRGLEHRTDIQMFDRRANGGGRRCRDWRVTEMRMKLFELPHLAERAPAQVTAPRFPQAGMGDRIDAARAVEPRGHLMGQALVLHETVLARRLNGLLVQTHGVGVPPFEPGDLGRHQGVFVAKRRWIVVGPLAQLFPVRRQQAAPLALPVEWGGLVDRSDSERAEVVEIEQLDTSVRGPEQRLRFPRRGDRRIVVARHDARLDLEDPIPADHRGHSVLGQLGLEGRLVKVCIAERGEARSPSAHVFDESLLAHDNVGHVAIPGLADEIQALLRLAPHRVEWIVPQEKDTDGSEHTVASGGQIPPLGRGAKGRPIEIDCGSDWLCPEGNYSHRSVSLRLVGDEAVLLDQVARELCETITLPVTVKHPTEDRPKSAIGMRGRSARPVLHADVHHAAHEQAIQMEVGKVGGRMQG